MADLELVNPVLVANVGAWAGNLSTALLGDPHDQHAESRAAWWASDWDPARTWGVRADGRWVATLATRAQSLTVPGAPGEAAGVIAADAVTAVSVNAAYRRRGLLTRMLTVSLAAARERGDAVSILVAAEWPIYGRFGYAPTDRRAKYTYFPRLSGAVVSATPTSTVRQVEAAELRNVAHQVFAAARTRRAGQIDRDELWWRRSLGLDGFQRPGPTPHYFLHDGPTGPDGLLSWKAASRFGLDGSLGTAEVEDLIAANDDAYRNLWALLSGLDLIGEVQMRGRPVDEPARWLMADGRALRQTYAGDFTWLRLLDVPAALSARCYSAAGRLVLDVVEDGSGSAAGRFVLDGTPDGATCSPTVAGADLRLTQRALASAYLGGYSLHELAISGVVTELTAGALTRADSMFTTPLAPWNATSF